MPTTVPRPALSSPTWSHCVRGDVYQLKAPRDARGHEQGGNRFAVVVQSDLLPLSTWLVVPTSTSARPASFRPQVEISGKSTLVLVEQIAAIDPERLGQPVGHFGRREMSDIDKAIRVVLHLDWPSRARAPRRGICPMRSPDREPTPVGDALT